tara:strand:- start:980 stop:1387 length:408 start_codon:yes stop_codon:yes gene_type:complete
VETQATATSGITFRVNTEVLADIGETTTNAVVDAKHALDAAKEAWVEAEKAFLALGVDSFTTSDGNTVDVIRGETRSVDVELLRTLVGIDLWDRVTTISASIGSLDREVKDGRTTDAIVESAITRKDKKPFAKVK